MKHMLSYKVTGILAVAIAALGLNLGMSSAASAQDAAPVPEATAPAAPAAADANAAKDFMREAFMANEFGIAAGQLAATQSDSAEIKAAAKQVVDNGLKTREGMVAAIQASTSDMHFDQNFSEDYKAKLGELKVAKGADFDAKYVAAQGAVTDKAESVFKAYAATGTDDSVKTFASNTLPTLAADGDKLDSVSQGGN